MCGALLDKIKQDLHIANVNSRQDTEYLLDHSHAADLDINSIGNYHCNSSFLCLLLIILLPRSPSSH